VRSKRWLAAHPEAWADQPKQRRAARRADRRAQPNRRSVTRLGLRKPGGRLP
jgi:CDP-diacylglycerol--serine O-phosphatidyltransferase